MKFTPSTDYALLKRQAYALHSMLCSQERELNIYRKKDYTLSKSKLDSLKESLDSEREMNATLTQELEDV